MHEDIREFGQAVAGVTYVLRPSAYAVIFHNGHVAVLSTPRGVFLPGGGQHDGEAPAQTVVRESMEECGLRVRPSRQLGKADQLVFTVAHAIGLRKRCTFLVAEVEAVTGESREVDHTLIWLSPREAAAKLSYESHRWALGECGRRPLELA